MDDLSLRLANALVGNPLGKRRADLGAGITSETCAGLEISYPQGVISVTKLHAQLVMLITNRSELQRCQHDLAILAACVLRVSCNFRSNVHFIGSLSPSFTVKTALKVWSSPRK